MKKISYILFTLFVICHALPAFAKSGVEAIIEKDLKENGEFNEFYDPNDPSTWVNDDYSYDPNTTSGNYDVNMSFANMKEAIGDSLGIPEASYLILILFSLAALLQMGRVMSGNGDWVAFSVRVLVILAFLRCYSELFDGIEMFFAYLGEHILNGQSAYETFWAKQETLYYALSDSKTGSGMGSFLDPTFLKQGIFYGLTCITSILAYAFYSLIFLAQSCIVITLRYLGPIIISLAVIPETDFSSGFINTTFQTYSWGVVGAILIKIMSTMATFGTITQLSMQDMVSLSAMNLCYALAFLFIPIMTGMIFTGKGLGGLGFALTALGGGVVKSVSGMIRRNTADRALSAVGGASVALGGWAMNKSASLAWGGAKSVTGAAMRPIASMGSAASKQIKPHMTYAFDHMKRMTPAGRAQFNHKYYGNYGMGGSAKKG